MTKHAVAIAAGLVLMGSVARTQSARPPATLDDVLQELRAVRADVTRVASAGVRTQLLVGRLQLEEQRIAQLSSQLSTVQLQARSMEDGLNQMASDVEAAERSLDRQPVEQQQYLSAQTKAMKQQVEQMRLQSQTLRQRELDLSGAIASEQARWSDFNNALDAIQKELER